MAKKKESEIEVTKQSHFLVRIQGMSFVMSVEDIEKLRDKLDALLDWEE